MSGRVVVTGSLAFDHITDIPGRFADHILPEKIHILNLSFTLKTLKKQYGGTAGNIAYSLALLGEQPTLWAMAGSDFLPYKRHLQAAGVDTSGVVIRKDLLTATFFVMTDRADNQIGGFYPGPLDKPYPLKVRGLKKIPSLMIISPNNPKLMIRFARECRSQKIPFIFDPGQQIIRLDKKLLLAGLTGAQVVIGNDYEIELIRKKTDLSNKGLLSKVAALITTKGDQGSIIETPTESFSIPSVSSVKVVDPTGAGGAYRAGLILGLLNRWSWEKTGRVAALAAVYAVEKYGTQEHYYTMDSFKKRFRNYFGFSL